MTVSNYYGTPAPIFAEFLAALPAHGWVVGTDQDTGGPAVYGGDRARVEHAETGTTCWADWDRGRVLTDFWRGNTNRVSRVTVTPDDPGAGAARWAKGPGVRAIEEHRIAVAAQAERDREAASLQAARQSLIDALTAQGYDAALTGSDNVTTYTENYSRVTVSFRSDGSSATLDVGWVPASDIRSMAALMVAIADHLDEAD